MMLLHFNQSIISQLTLLTTTPFSGTPISPEMNSHLSFSSSLLCLLLIISVKIQPSSSCAPQFTCGNITAGYPFWGGPRGQQCGHPQLQLNCDEHVPGSTSHYMLPTMIINEVTYLVLDIKSEAKTLRIARIDYLSGVCSPEFPSTTVDTELFDYSEGYKNVTFLYDCPASADPLPPGSTCPNVSIKEGNLGPGKCSASVIFPVRKDLPLLEIAQQPLVLSEGFELKWKLGGMSCEDCTNSKGICGYNRDSSKTNCYCPNSAQPSDRACSTSPANPPSPSGSFFNKRWKIAIGITAAVVGLIIILTILLISSTNRGLAFLKRKTENDRNVEAFVRNFGSLAPKNYNYSDVKRMTKSFSEKLGQGGYGDVYRGKLPDGRLVAVKFLKESKGDGEEFVNEVASISRTSHVNIVTLLGFCHERRKRALIYEFMPNGSLDKFRNCRLEWKKMYQIAVGIARGLEYLHRGCTTSIVHFDIKPHNILLDEDLCPKIADFGLAKLCKKKQNTISMSMLGARGTIGYIVPEMFCRNFGKVSHKSDVYSYGMMILEMVGGRKNIDVREVSHTSEIYFPNWIYKQIEDPGKDFEFHGVVTQEDKEVVNKMILVSLWCIQTITSDRPSMTRVLEMLEGGLENLQVPPKTLFGFSDRITTSFPPITSSSESNTNEIKLLEG